jgi:hypothetical protein
MRQVPYNTGKVLIGCRYEPQLRSHVTEEGEFWQSVLLGEYQHRRRERVQFGWYMAILVGVFALMGWFA